MKYPELERRLNSGTYKVVNWAADGHFSEVAYNIVPTTDGGFQIYYPSGRGEYFPIEDAQSIPVYFATEDEACEFVWQQAQEAERPAPRIAPRTAERIADRKRRFDENQAKHNGSTSR